MIIDINVKLVIGGKVYDLAAGKEYDNLPKDVTDELASMGLIESKPARKQQSSTQKEE